jgi:hypothetical protein
MSTLTKTIIGAATILVAGAAVAAYRLSGFRHNEVIEELNIPAEPVSSNAKNGAASQKKKVIKTKKAAAVANKSTTKKVKKTVPVIDKPAAKKTIKSFTELELAAV